MKKEKKPIFIHSLFRTGSTYIWNKFRQNENYYCYYEPFHQDLARMSLPHPVIWSFDKESTSIMGHPDLDRDHLFEYRWFNDFGYDKLPFFKKSFSFDEYFYNQDNPDLKSYIDYLIAMADGKIPVFKFCRSALRTYWFSNNYQGASSIYIFRNPRHQWQSYVDMENQKNRIIFQVMDLIVVSKNMELPLLKPITDEIPLVKYHSESFRDEEFIYRELIRAYSYEERYFIFYFLWFKSFLENLFNAGLMLSINRLSEDVNYREEIHEWLRVKGFDGVDFNDTNIKHYTNLLLENKVMEKIERDIHREVLSTLSPEQVDRFFARLSTLNNDFLKIEKPIPLKANGPGDKKNTTVNEKRAAKYERMVNILVDSTVSLKHELDNEKRKGLQAMKDKENTKKKYEEILNNRDKKINEFNQRDNHFISRTLNSLMTRIKKKSEDKRIG